MGAFNDLQNSLLNNAQIPADERLSNLTTFASVVSIIVNLFIGVAFSVSFIGLAYGFIQMALAQGDKIGLQKARSAVFASVIAMFVAILAVVLKNVLFRAFGASDQVTNNVPNV